MPIRFRMKEGVGRHSMILDGAPITVAPGEIVSCDKEDLGSALDKFDQLDPDAPEAAPNHAALITVPSRDIHGMFDVISAVTKAKINDRPLSFDEAASIADRAPHRNEDGSPIEAEPQADEPKDPDAGK